MPGLPAPTELEPFEVLFDSSEPNPALPAELVRFCGNLGFPSPPPGRPWVYSNFAQSLDGMVTFGGQHPQGRWIAQSRHDRWMMDLLRAHADAVLYGTGSLIQEALYGGIPGGPVFRITHPDLLRLRRERLGRGKQSNIVVTGSGRLRLADYLLFQTNETSPDVEAWIATTAEGLKRLGQTGKIPVLVFGEARSVDLGALLRALREQHGVQYLLCEGGPTLYGAMARDGWMDEKFLTIAPQEIGPCSPEAAAAQTGKASEPRLTTIAGVGFSRETARWYRWISCRKAGDHEFNRYRFLAREAVHEGTE